MSKYYTLKCDGCGKEVKENDARIFSWKRLEVSVPSGGYLSEDGDDKHVCPECEIKIVRKGE